VTIVGNKDCFVGVAPKAVSPDLHERVRSELAGCTEASVMLFQLEVFLSITNQRLGLDELESEDWTSKWQGFVGALGSPNFAPRHGYKIYRLVRLALERLGDESTLSGWSFPWDPGAPAPEPLASAIAAFEARRLDAGECDFWSGWTASNKLGTHTALRLHGMHRRLGSEFTRQFEAACALQLRSGAMTQIAPVNSFSDYVCAYPKELSVRHFADAKLLESFLHQFAFWYFRSQRAAGSKLKTISSAWSVFARFLERHLLGYSWARLPRKLPRPKPPGDQEDSPNIRRRSAGDLITYKLITEIPLHVTDEQAIELLWSTIRLDVDHVVASAQAVRAAAWQRHLARQELAKKGQPSEIGPPGINLGSSWRISRENPDYLANAAATFEAFGLRPSSRLHLTYPRPLPLVAWELGLPTPQVIIAYATLLVRHHPLITPAFLASVRIFNSQGRMTGLFQTDAGWHLRGFKNRKGAKRAKQDVLLTQETKAVVDELITLTKPLREYLRTQGDESWRLLFLTISSMGAEPSAASFDCVDVRPSLCASLQQFAGLSPREARDLAGRFTLPRLRASCGTLIYLETQSVYSMAEALGHTSYKPNLLDRYLPRPLQEFFMERWVRLFQTGILCECMQGSDLLGMATGLSPEELPKFLDKHALREIPQHLKNPENVADPAPQSESQIVFSISVPTLTALITVQRAVGESSSTASGAAKRWAAIADKLLPYLGNEQLFQPMLADAREICDANAAEVLEYE